MKVHSTQNGKGITPLGVGFLFYSILFAVLLVLPAELPAQAPTKNIVRTWSEALLVAVELDGQGPTIHSRNLYHTFLGMYDAWAMYEPDAEPHFLGGEMGGISCPCEAGFKIPDSLNTDSAQQIAMSFAAYRIIRRRFNLTGSKNRILDAVDFLFEDLGYNRHDVSLDYQDGSPEHLGNYIGQCIINFGIQDGAGEEDRFEPILYVPSNPPLRPELPGNSTLINPNRWQPLALLNYINHRGGDPSLVDWNFNLIQNSDIFLTPEWGDVVPFSLTQQDLVVKDYEGFKNNVYLDPGPPPLLESTPHSLSSEYYKWGFVTNALWSAYLDPENPTLIDISPGAMGNYGPLPETYADFPSYFDQFNGGTHPKGRKKNPKTGKPYAPNTVPLGDYTRVIAEYWVDGVNTASPPGHWIQTLEQVTDHPLFVRKWQGKGKEMDPLEWELKSHLALAGALHDAGIAAWSVKGWYDYIRPISALRYMADKGQCSDSTLPHYHPAGLPLIKNRIALVGKKDPLVGEKKEHLHKIKVYCWRGPEYVQDATTDHAGVGWILMENWWPYQRYSFLTPPFAGYVSGHSTFSIAAAEMLTLMTGDPYFPGGLAEFTAKKNQFLVFEAGPSQDITLQWATYRDAADETCLSRIWGGIHPPADDIPGRKMGEQIAVKAFQLSNKIFNRRP